MLMQRGERIVRLLTVTAVLGVLLAGASLPGASARAQGSAFDAVWATTDAAVAAGQAGYSWFWGPSALLQTHEVYAGSPDDQREVRYYDKSRMEINDPNGNQSSIYYVTNGLLTSELVTGRLQWSDGDFEQRAPADVPIAGDPNANPGTPSYAEMAPWTTTDGVSNRASDRAGQEVTEFLNGSGERSTTAAAGVSYTQYQSVTGHNFADVFWDWANDPDSGFRPEQGVNWVYVLGYPTSEPYWIDSTVGGQPRRVLVQLFERRVLTYTAGNPDAFKVEYGNIGQHYYRWRYNVSETALVPTRHTVAFTSAIGFDVDVLAVDLTNPGTPVNLTDQHAGIDGAPFWSPDGQRIAMARGGMGDGFSIATIAANGSDPRIIAATAHGWFGWSYDSRYLAYRLGDQVVVVEEATLQVTPVGTGRVATWSPDSLELLVTNVNSTRVERVNPFTAASTTIANVTGGGFVQALLWLRGDKYAAILDNVELGVSCAQRYALPSTAVDIAPSCANSERLAVLRPSADHTQVAYIVGDSRVQVLDVTGSGRVRDLAFTAEGSGSTVITGLDWSYAPSELVIGARRGNSSTLYAVKHDNAGQRRLTDPSLITAALPAVSPGY